MPKPAWCAVAVWATIGCSQVPAESVAPVPVSSEPQDDSRWLSPSAIEGPAEEVSGFEAPEPESQRADCRLLPDRQVRYEVGKFGIKPASFEILDALVELMKQHPDWHIEVGVHTDHTGSSTFNLGISKKRAQVVVETLVSRGIHPSRVQGRGYGEDRPIMPNDTAEGRAMNRRTEFLRLDGACAPSPPPVFNPP